MTPTQTILAVATGISLLATPAISGGPVIIEDEYTVTEPAPRNDWIIPVIIGGIVLCAIACGGDDDAPVAQPPKAPGPVCYSGDC